jgi:hypothetical protein
LQMLHLDTIACTVLYTEILFIQLSYNELDINYLRRRCFQADFRFVMDNIAFVPFSSTGFLKLLCALCHERDFSMSIVGFTFSTVFLEKF